MLAVVINTGFFGTFPFCILAGVLAIVFIFVIDALKGWVHEQESNGNFLFRKVTCKFLYIFHPGAVCILLLLALLFMDWFV
jgi:hypothetical protein